MVLRRKSAGRSHVARLAVVGLISLGLVGLGGSADADPSADRTQADSQLCLPDSPVDLPADLNVCVQNDNDGLPSVAPSDSSPGQDTQADPGTPTDSAPIIDPDKGLNTSSDSDSDDSVGDICVPLPEKLLNKLPTEILKQLPNEVPTCIPACASDALLQGLKKLPDSTLQELLDYIVTKTGEMPDCLLSLVPIGSSPSEPPPSDEPEPQEPQEHAHHHVPHHVPWHAGPAVPVDGSPSYTG